MAARGTLRRLAVLLDASAALGLVSAAIATYEALLFAVLGHIVDWLGRVTPETFWAAALNTGRTIPLEYEGKRVELGTIADFDDDVAILLHSSEDAELLAQCSRILVFNAGRVVAELSGDRRDAFHLTRAAYGEAT